MKYFVKFFVITLLVLLCTYALADSSQIRFINLKVILNESKAGKEAQDFLKKSAEENINKFKETEDSLKQQETDLISKKNVLSKEEDKKMADNLRKNVREYQKERDSKLKKISTLRTEARSKLISEIKPILTEYTKENNISIVFNSKDVLYADPELEVTKIIIKLLDKKLPSLNLK